MNKYFQKYYKFLSFATLVGIISACSSTKKVPEGEYLLTKNKFEFTDKPLFSGIIPDYVYQKPNNRNLLQMPISLWLYNGADPKYDTILAEYMSFPSHMRNRKLRDSLSVKYGHPEYVGKSMMWSRVRHTFGKAPVILDDTKTQQSANSIRRYLAYRGYWDTEVHYETKKDSANQKAENKFVITHKDPTYVAGLYNRIPYPEIKEIYENNKAKSFIKEGDILDQAKLEQEIKRVNDMMRDAGYYTFNTTNEEVFFVTDTLRSRKRVPLILEVQKDTLGGDYKKHTIGKIEITIKDNASDSEYDLIEEEVEDIIVRKSSEDYKGKAIWRAITINKDDVYNQRRIDLTRRNLLAMNNFSIVNANPLELRSPNDTILDLKYTLIPLQRYELKLATDVHYSQILNFGFSPSLEFTSRNIFRGGENFGVSISGIVGSTKNEDNKHFNAYELSGEVSLKFPRLLLPFKGDKLIPRRYSPTSAITLGTSVQNNIGLGRINFNGGINYYLNVNDVISHRFSVFNTQLSRTRNKDNYYDLFPADREVRDYIFNLYSAENPTLVDDFYKGKISSDVVSQEIMRANDFRNNLNAHDQGQMTLFGQSMINKDRQTQDALIMGVDYNYLYNEIGKKEYKNPFYFSAKFELAGNLLSLLEKIGGSKEVESGVIDPVKKSFFRIPYYQFAKFDLDIRKYLNFNDNRQTLIFRQFIGLGIPYGNSSTMPYIRSYYNGGSSDIRAWRAYGGLGPSDSQLDKNIRKYMMGNMKLTTNIEYRFVMNNMFHGAIFTDLGNTWTIGEASEGNDSFKLSQFYKQLGIGSGFGLRMNIAYVTFRFDFAYKVYDPNQPEGQRWVISDIKPLKPVVNFAIGYPF